jgi:hypothetical protein
MLVALLNSGWHRYGQIQAQFPASFTLYSTLLSLKSLDIYSLIVLGWKQAGFETVTKK